MIKISWDKLEKSVTYEFKLSTLEVLVLYRHDLNSVFTVPADGLAPFIEDHKLQMWWFIHVPVAVNDLDEHFEDQKPCIFQTVRGYLTRSSGTSRVGNVGLYRTWIKLADSLLCCADVLSILAEWTWQHEFLVTFQPFFFFQVHPSDCYFQKKLNLNVNDCCRERIIKWLCKLSICCTWILLQYIYNFDTYIYLNSKTQSNVDLLS